MAENVTLDWPCQGVAVATVTARDTSNGTIDFATINELANALHEANMAGARSIILASGLKSGWLAHAHLDDLRRRALGEPLGVDTTGWLRVMGTLRETNAVTIAAINGDTSGGGCELGWACDLRVAEDHARFSQPEVIIGVGTGIGGSSRLMRLIGRTVTAEMVLTGYPVSAQRIYDLGGLNYVVDAGGALDKALELACSIAERSPAAVAGMKRMLNEGEDLSLTDALSNDQRISRALLEVPETQDNMARIQALFDSGETMDKVYWQQ